MWKWAAVWLQNILALVLRMPDCVSVSVDQGSVFVMYFGVLEAVKGRESKLLKFIISILTLGRKQKEN